MKKLFILLLLSIPIVGVASAQSSLSGTGATENSSQFNIRTNMLYWLGGNANIGVEWTPKNSRLGVVVNGGYSPLASTDWNHNLGGWFAAPEVRYYIGKSENWFVGAQFLAADYNVKLSETGYQGSLMGGGVTAGYKLPISRVLDLDFSLGMGYGTLKYDSYYKHENGTNIYIEQGVETSKFIPIQAGVSLIFKL
ncbi:MAG: DUF3575 domain-containing protein [Rikenellaceae bacterium]